MDKRLLDIFAPRFWWELCGRYTTHFIKKFGFFSPCVGCHFYIHTVRVPIAKLLQSNLVIGGERITRWEVKS